MDEYFKYFLPIFLPIYFAVAFVLPSYRVWKQTGVNPVTFGGADNAHDYIGKLFKIVMLGLTAVVIIYAFLPGIYHYLLPVFWLKTGTVRYVGIGLLLISLLWTVLAQIQMAHWHRRRKTDGARQVRLIRFIAQPDLSRDDRHARRNAFDAAECLHAFDFLFRIRADTDSSKARRRVLKPHARRGIR